MPSLPWEGGLLSTGRISSLSHRHFASPKICPKPHLKAPRRLKTDFKIFLDRRWFLWVSRPRGSWLVWSLISGSRFGNHQRVVDRRVPYIGVSFGRGEGGGYRLWVHPNSPSHESRLKGRGYPLFYSLGLAAVHFPGAGAVTLCRNSRRDRFSNNA